MRLIWHPEAQHEFVEAAGYYERREDDLGERFITHIEAALAKLLTSPLVARCFDGDCRKGRVDRFPYVLIYRVHDDELKIVAVMHQKRRPGYWKTRLSN